MITRIRNCGHGGYTVETGKQIESCENPCGIGFIQPGFFVYESCHCDDMRMAKKVANRQSNRFETEILVDCK